jgi:hypothetical protein
MELTEQPTAQPSLASITPNKPPASTPNTTPIRIHKQTAKELRSIITKCNRKAHGRTVKADDIIAAAIELLTDEHLEKIKRSTYSSSDQLEIEFKSFCKTNGPLSKDEFLKLILSRALPQDSRPTKTNSKNSEA